MDEQLSFHTETFIQPLDKWFHSGYYPSPQGLSVYFRDITEKKLSEQKLKESEELYRTIVDTAHEGILQIDENNKVTFANTQLCSFLGYTPNEVLGKNALHFLGQDNQEIAIWRIENRKLGVAEQYEMSLLSKTGKQVHTLVNSRPLFKNDKYAGSISTIMDITERKYIEEKTLVNEKRLNALFENSSNGICLFSPEGVIVEINPAVEKILGYKREELIGTKPNLIVPEHLPLVLVTIADVLNDENIIRTIEYIIIKKDGEKKWLRATYRNMISNPDIANIVINFVDIDESKSIQQDLVESETRYRKAQSQGKLGHWHRDLSNGRVSWSEEVYNIFEQDNTTEIADYISFLNLVHPEDRNFVAEEHQLALKGFKEFNLFYRIITKSGSIKHLHEVADISKDDRGKPVYLSGMVQDVTEQKLTEEQLKESQQQLSIILNNIVDAVSLFEVEGINQFRYLAVNDAYITTNGIDRDSALGKLLGELKPSHNFDRIFKVFNQAINSCEIQKFESEYNLHEQVLAYMITVVPIKNGRGLCDRILVIAKDVTERKFNEQKLIKSEEKNRILFEQIPVPIWILNKDLNFIQVNETAVSEYGYSKEEFLSMNLLNIKTPEDHPYLLDVIKNWDSTHSYSGVTTHITKTGEIIYSRVHSTTLNLDQQDVILVATKNVTLEILAQKEIIENEQQLSLIFDSTQDGMWLINVEDGNNYRIETYNKAYEAITGIQKNAAVGMLLQDIFPPETFEKIKNKYKQVIETGQILNYFTTMRFSKGEITAEVTLTPIKDHRGKVVRVLGSGVDVTQQQKARKELDKMNRDLRDLASHLQNVREEERTHIAREIHDELGQQLTGLKMDLAWLKKKIDVDEQTVVSKINSALQLVDGTINSVRKIASELRPSIIDDLGINEAIDWHCQDFSKRTGINVHFESDVNVEDLPKHAPIALYRIVQEALTNVARHSKATDVTCTLLRINDELVLSIIDNGIGFNSDSQTKTLGLIGMKERVLMLKGKYEITSEINKGTVIVVSIPVNL
jgi:PAS domain S-box-containing protein